MSHDAGIVIVLAAPSGAGKQALLDKLEEMGIAFETTVSATTRARRKGEKEGREYHFLSKAEFQARVARNEFVEFALVHKDLYGTLKDELDRRHACPCLIMELDVQGMRSLKKLGVDMVSVFVMAPSIEELARRLRHRGADDEDTIALRLRNAETEIAARGEFDYIIVNDDLDGAAADFAAIVRAERCRTRRQLQ